MKSFKNQDNPTVLFVISYFFPPFFSPGGSIRIVKFLKYLPSLGWQSHLLTVDDRHEYANLHREGSEELLQDLPKETTVWRAGYGEPTVDLLQRGRKAREKNIWARLAINILRAIRVWVTRWFLIPDEQLPWLPAAFTAGKRIVREKNADIILATCPPHSAALVGALIRWCTHKPLILDFRDDWVDTPWYMKKPPLVRLANRVLECWVVNRAARLILVTPLSCESYRKRYPSLPDEKFICIPNGVDLEDFPQPIIPNLSQSQTLFTIVHAGLLTVAQDWQRSPEAVFKAMTKIIEQEPEAGHQMRLIFTGSLPQIYRSRVAELGLKNVIETGYLPKPEFIKLLQHADVLLSINYAGFSTLVPGKIYEYWAVGGPPILSISSPGAAQQLIDRHNLGVSLDFDKEEKIASTLLDFYHRRQAGKPIRICREGIEAYGRHSLAKQLNHTLREVLAEERLLSERRAK